jgi:hypothetical protein
MSHQSLQHCWHLQTRIDNAALICFVNFSVFDFDDETIPMELRNGFTFLKADEQVIAVSVYILS